MGTDFEYTLPAVNMSGASSSLGIVISGCCLSVLRAATLSVCLLSLNGSSAAWWLTLVYGPTLLAEKAAFLDELRSTKQSCPGASLYCDDFNMIYRDQDKNEGVLHRGWMPTPSTTCSSRRYTSMVASTLGRTSDVNRPLNGWIVCSPRLPGSTPFATTISCASPLTALITHPCH